jgi:hypothetical protein
MRAVPAYCRDLHREKVRVEEDGDGCMNRNERRIACIRLMLGPDPARSIASGRLLKRSNLVSIRDYRDCRV